MRSLRYLSLCSGIEAASVAWGPLGWEAVGFCEIEAFPAAVLAHRFPAVPNYGDMTQLEGGRNLGTVDIVVGGTPCQGFSIAGKRGGLADERSGLAMHFVRIVSEILPKWIIWENVPGVFSTHGGRDFGTFVRALAECGYHLAWRVLDAQFFGVPQRRRRIFVVGHLGDWRYPASVLFESESLCGHPAPGGKAETAAASGAQGGPGTRRGTARVTQSLTHSFGCGGADDNRAQGGFYISVVPPLTTSSYASNNPSQAGKLIPVARCLTSRAERYDFETETLIPSIPSHAHGVRRITPLEAERLQGFPDGWTDIPWRGRPAPDRLRYRALGNAMCVNVMRWLGERITRYGHA